MLLRAARQPNRDGWPARVLVGAALALIATACSRPAPPREDAWRPAGPAGAVALPGQVLFNAMQVIVENQGDQMWREVDVEVFRPGDRTAYRYRADAILGRRSVTVGALHFAAADGTRLSPFAGAPTVFAVTAKLPDGSTGFVTGALREVAPP